MAITYQEFMREPVDLQAMGIELGGEREPYFCTPRGAEIFGWAGVDGIHYCFVPGFGETVFAVNPMGADYVRPLAKNFEDFLRLLLACGDVAALDQAAAPQGVGSGEIKIQLGDRLGAAQRLRDEKGLACRGLTVEDGFYFGTA